MSTEPFDMPSYNNGFRAGVVIGEQETLDRLRVGAAQRAVAAIRAEYRIAATYDDRERIIQALTRGAVEAILGDVE